MKNFRINKTKVLFECQADECAAPGGVHSVSKSEVIATMFTLLEEMYSRDDIRVQEVKVACFMLWEALYPDSRNTDKDWESPPFKKSLDELRLMMNTIAFTKAFESYDADTAN